jgi:MFS family permease
LTDGSVVSNMSATSCAWNPRTSRRIRTASWRGGSTCSADERQRDGLGLLVARFRADGEVERSVQERVRERPEPHSLAEPGGLTERNRALGLYGATAGISASVGVTASGLLTDGPGWRWVFFINVPIGVLLAAMAATFLATDARDRRRSERFDLAGAFTVTGGLLLAIYGLNRGADLGWGSASTLGLFAASVVTLSAFVAIEARSRSPLVPGSAVRNRTLVAANLSAFFTFGAFFAFIFLGSPLMQQVLGYSATRTGVAWLATTATSFVAAAITGAKLADLVGVRRLLVAGQLLLAISVLLLTRVPVGGHYATDLLPALLLAGVAGGLAAPAAQIGALTGVTHAMTGLASGLVETAREIGGAVGVAAVSTVLVSRAGVNAFRAAFWVVLAIAALGALTAGIAFPRRTTSQLELGAAPSHPPIIPEPTEALRA